MNNILISFILTTLAGLSTLIGSLIIFIKNDKNKVIASSLFFAAGIMITISTVDLIPESFEILYDNYSIIPTILLVLIFIVLGFICSNAIEKRINVSDELYKVGVLSMLAIILHNIPEGIITFITSTNNLSLGFSLAIAIALHNIPEGISIAVPVYHATNSRLKAILYTLISGLSELLGAIIAYLFLTNFINDSIMAFLYSFVAGIMIYISLFDLLPTAIKYKNKTYLYFVLGFLVMMFSLYLLK